MSGIPDQQGDKREGGDNSVTNLPVYSEAPRKPLAIRYAEAGQLISRSPRTIRRMIDRGELIGLRDVALVDYASLEAWVSERRGD